MPSIANEAQVKEQLRNRYELAAYFAKEFMDEIGRERALEIIGRAWERWWTDQMKRFAGSMERNDLPTWAARVKAAPTIEVESFEESDNEFKVRITRCLHYEVFKELGAPEVCSKYCDADYPGARAYNPKMRMVREREIANGADICDHHWIMEG